MSSESDEVDYKLTNLMSLCINCENITPKMINEMKDEIGIQNSFGKSALISYCVYNEIGMKSMNNTTALMELYKRNYPLTPEIIKEFKHF